MSCQVAGPHSVEVILHDTWKLLGIYRWLQLLRLSRWYCYQIERSTNLRRLDPNNNHKISTMQVHKIIIIMIIVPVIIVVFQSIPPLFKPYIKKIRIKLCIPSFHKCVLLCSRNILWKRLSVSGHKTWWRTPKISGSKTLQKMIMMMMTLLIL